MSDPSQSVLDFSIPDMPDVKTEATQELTAKHQEIIRLKFETLSNQEISERVGVCVATVNNICTSPMGKIQLQGLAELADDDSVAVRMRIDRLAPKCMDVLEAVVNDKEGVMKSQVPLSLRVKTANGILDRAGHTPTHKVEQVGGHGAMEALGRQLLMKAALDAGVLQPVIDVTPREESG